jgi:hypothetical protein
MDTIAKNLLERLFRFKSGRAAFNSAEGLEQKSFSKYGPAISLLHATRGRVHKAFQTRHLWMATAKNPDSIEHIFAYDSDDSASKEAMSTVRHVEIKEGGTCIKAWNAAAEFSRGGVLIQLSDDWIPAPHWDELILKRLNTKKSQVLAISDGYRRDRLLCMAILTRKRYEQQGYLFHPDFESMFSDDWFTFAAYKDGVVVDAKDIIFTHDHPHFVNGELDETYKHNNQPERYKKGEETFVRLRKKIYGD